MTISKVNSFARCLCSLWKSSTRLCCFLCHQAELHFSKFDKFMFTHSSTKRVQLKIDQSVPQNLRSLVTSNHLTRKLQSFAVWYWLFLRFKVPVSLKQKIPPAVFQNSAIWRQTWSDGRERLVQNDYKTPWKNRGGVGKRITILPPAYIVFSNCQLRVLL